MMTITVNGHSHTLPSSLTLSQLMSQLQIEAKSLAVAINSEIVSRSHFETRWIQDNDVVEIIRAVGGG